MLKRWMVLVVVITMVLGCTTKQGHEMGYIVQVSSGSWHKANYTVEQIIQRLETVTACVPVKKVIIGWNLDRAMYEQLGAWLHARNIEMLFWLPIFAETEEVCCQMPAVDMWGRIPTVELDYCEGFRFNCPCRQQTIEDIEALYEAELADCPFDGVFMDRIRTQSFVCGVSGVLNCGCEVCRAQYAQRGVELDDVREAVERKGDLFFSVSGYDPEQGFVFEDSLAERFFRVKGQLIGEQVAQIADYFHERHLVVGMDVYAPLMAVFVGQDYALLASHADFLKPMLYRRTYAPAGIGYEYEWLRKSIPQAKGYPTLEMDVEFLRGQLEAMSSLPCEVYPGIEINYYPKTAPTSAEYVAESMGVVEECGCSGAVLSWDVMQAPDEHLPSRVNEQLGAEKK